MQNDRLWQHQQMMAGRNPFQTAAAGLPADAVPQPGGSTFTFPGLPFSGAQPALQQVASDPSLPSRPQDQHVVSGSCSGHICVIYAGAKKA